MKDCPHKNNFVFYEAWPIVCVPLEIGAIVKNGLVCA
jgi:hypothetical protein